MEWAENHLLEAVIVAEQPSPNAALLEFFKTSASEFATRREIEPGTCLVRAGAPSDGYFIVETGQLSVTFPAQSGLDFRLRTVGKGALIGEVGHYNNVPRTTTVTTLTDCVVWHMSGQALRRMEAENIYAAMVLHRLAAVCLAKRLDDNTTLLDRTR